MIEKYKIFAISGSTRQNSSNESILKFIADKYAEIMDVEIYEGIDKLPHFNPDLGGENLPGSVKDFRRLIESADGVIICTPEYVFSLPGSLKNAIEWNVSTTLFSNKPVAIIVASASGEKAFESLELVMTTIESKIGEDSKLLIKAAKGRIGTGGEITDLTIVSEIEKLVISLMDSINEVKAKSL